uniref:Uncharacterized protein n=1 Tax=Monodelphis domestica TaxID=13616 RepID=A0A5F8GM79_MONDO
TVHHGTLSPLPHGFTGRPQSPNGGAPGLTHGSIRPAAQGNRPRRSRAAPNRGLAVAHRPNKAGSAGGKAPCSGSRPQEGAARPGQRHVPEAEAREFGPSVPVPGGRSKFASRAHPPLWLRSPAQGSKK